MKTRTFLALYVAGAILMPAQQPVISGTTVQVTLPDGVADQIRVLKGYKINPVDLNMDGRDPVMVGLGSYLVNTGGCNDCHTNPSYTADGDPFQGLPAKVNAAGYLGGGQAFGPFTSRNLTPEPANGNLPAGLSYDDFYKVLKTGIDLDNLHPAMGPLLQVMPWPTISNYTDAELRAMYEYLSAIPPVQVDGANKRPARRVQTPKK